MCDGLGAGLAEDVVLVDVVVGCAVGVEEDNDDADDADDEVVEEEEEEEEEEDDALLVTLKYCDLNRGPSPSFEALYIPSQKRLLSVRFCVGLASQE